MSCLLLTNGEQRLIYFFVFHFGIQSQKRILRLVSDTPSSVLYFRTQPRKRMTHCWLLELLMSKGRMLLQEDVYFCFLLEEMLIILRIWYFLGHMVLYFLQFRLILLHIFLPYARTVLFLFSFSFFLFSFLRSLFIIGNVQLLHY